MKEPRLAFAFIGILASSVCAAAAEGRSAASLSPAKLVGSWSGIDTGGRKTDMILFASGRAVFVIDGQARGDAGGDPANTTTYRVEAHSVPWRIDFLLKSGAGEKRTLRGLVEMSDVNTIRLGLGLQAANDANGPSSAGFSLLEEKSTMILRRALVTAAPRVIFQVAPDYPYSMRKAGFIGEVVVNFIVDIEGRPRDLFVERSTRREFEEPALAAVAKWRFDPGRVKGVAVNTKMSVPVRFAFEDSVPNQAADRMPGGNVPGDGGRH
jgi:TonB family protein